MTYVHKNPIVNAVRVISTRRGVSGLFEGTNSIPTWLTERIAKGDVRIRRSHWTTILLVEFLDREETWVRCESGDWLLEDDGELFCFDNDAFLRVYEQDIEKETG